MTDNHSYNQLTDEQLLHEYKQQKNQSLLAALYLRYAEMLYGVCMKYLKNQETAKDAVVDIYESLVKKLHVHEVSNFKSWLYVLAKNHCLMELRKHSNNTFASIDDFSFMQSDASLHLEEALTKEKKLLTLENCINQLQKEQQRSIQLFYLERKCYQEIAGLTGLEWNKVRSLIQNGKRNLKICMEKHG